MPLPRFTRLSEVRCRGILAVARSGLADDSSYNQIISAAGISKTSAYLYFDGKQDLIDEVLRDLASDLADVLGPWNPAADEEEFWAELHAGDVRLRSHLLANPTEAALLDRWYEEVAAGFADAWVRAVVEDGRRLGIIRSDIDIELLVLATAAVLRAADCWLVKLLAGGEPAPPEVAWQLLAGLWSP